MDVALDFNYERFGCLENTHRYDLAFLKCFQIQIHFYLLSG